MRDGFKPDRGPGAVKSDPASVPRASNDGVGVRQEPRPDRGPRVAVRAADICHVIGHREKSRSDLRRSPPKSESSSRSSFEGWPLRGGGQCKDLRGTRWFR